MSVNFRETEKFRRGRSGEQLVAELLMKRGWFVIPSYDYSGEDGNKAPKMQGKDVAYVIPDLDIGKSGLRRWAEVKTKKEPTLYRKTNTMEHGIPIRHLRHYQQVERETGCEVWLFVYEKLTQIVRFAKLAELGAGRVYDGQKMSHGGMVFWPVSSFKVFATIGGAA